LDATEVGLIDQAVALMLLVVVHEDLGLAVVDHAVREGGAQRKDVDVVCLFSYLFTPFISLRFQEEESASDEKGFWKEH